MPAPFDWSDFEASLLDECLHALRKLGRAHRSERFYAVALYGVQRKLDGPMTLPLLAANTEDHAGDPSGGFWSARWNPADWQHEEVALRQRPALRLDRALTRHATRGTQAQWRNADERYRRVLVRIARALRDEAPKLLLVTDDFVAFVFDPELGTELARRTIPKRLFERLFAEQLEHAQQRSDVKRKSPRQRAAFLVTRFGKYEGVSWEDAERELLTLGESAVDALLPALSDTDNGWLAAAVLGRLGIARPDVLDALRERARADKGGWSARALGMLGDHAWLLAQREPGVRVDGVCAPYQGVAWKDSPPPPLDYRPLEELLEASDEAIAKRVDGVLAPGSAYRSIVSDDVDEALRGLTLPHAVIRWHATSRLGDRGLGKAAGKRLLPPLAERLADPDPFVRRFAVVSITGWKAAGRPYRDRVEALRDDPDETVRAIVDYALQ